jgi:toxin FitB
MILLDTNVVSEPLRPQPEPRVLEWLDAQTAETLYLSTISLSELLLGIENLSAGKRRRALALALGKQIADLFGGRILPFDIAAAQAYAKVVTIARRGGRAISVADGQIAAIAAARALTVATRDAGPFEAAGIAVINPWMAEL